MLYDQSHHMVNSSSRGPDALKLISDTGINSVANFPVEHGQAVHPGVAGGRRHRRRHPLPPRRGGVRLRRPRARSRTGWSSKGDGGYDCEVRSTTARRRGRTATPVTRDVWRFQIQGPNAWPVHREAATAAPLEQLKFFRMGDDEHRRRAGPHPPPRHGRRARAWRSGARTSPTRRSARPSSRPAASSGSSRAARARTPPTPSSPAGSRRRCRRSTPPRSCARYREWLPANGYEATNALAGSFVSDDIEDYYLNPWELGYGSFVKFDHDFIGRDALEAIDPEHAAPQGDARVERRGPRPRSSARSSRARAPGYQFFDLPNANYGVVELRLGGGRRRQGGRASLFTGYSANERKGLSLATVDPDVPIGAEVRVIWGEPDGGTPEDHRRAARAVRGARRRQPGAVRRDRPGRLPRGWRSAKARPERRRRSHAPPARRTRPISCCATRSSRGDCSRTSGSSRPTSVEELGVGAGGDPHRARPARAGAPRRTRTQPRSPGQHGLAAPGDRDPPGARGARGPDGEQGRRAHHAEGRRRAACATSRRSASSSTAATCSPRPTRTRPSTGASPRSPTTRRPNG